MSTKIILLSVAAVVTTLTFSRASANTLPPTGAILDLSGTPIPGGGDDTYQPYSVDFVADNPTTAITFAFREDPSFLSFADVSVTDLTHPSGNLLLNGDFSGGTYTSNGNGNTPVDWVYANVYGASFGGTVESNSVDCYAMSNCWYDGAVQAYDAISQTVPTTIGDKYQVAFDLADNSHCRNNGGGSSCNFSDLSTDGNTTTSGGNGINLTVYAEAGLPPAAVPEPSSALVLGTVLLGASELRRKLKR